MVPLEPLKTFLSIFWYSIFSYFQCAIFSKFSYFQYLIFSIFTKTKTGMVPLEPLKTFLSFLWLWSGFIATTTSLVTFLEVENNLALMKIFVVKLALDLHWFVCTTSIFCLQALTHERVPDIAPLPDALLDNIQYQRWLL